jgi:hypothetical protein
MIIHSKNALLLAELLEKIPNVVQCRFHYVIYKNIPYSPEAILFKVFIKSLDQSNPPYPGDFTFINISIIREPEVYEDLSTHSGIQAMLNEKIGHYYRTGIVPEIAPPFEPFSLNEEGELVPYDMTKSNPLR